MKGEDFLSKGDAPPNPVTTFLMLKFKNDLTGALVSDVPNKLILFYLLFTFRFA
jgi:hypothetical protein